MGISDLNSIFKPVDLNQWIAYREQKGLFKKQRNILKERELLFLTFYLPDYLKT